MTPVKITPVKQDYFLPQQLNIYGDLDINIDDSPSPIENEPNLPDKNLITPPQD